jgi:predicted DNA-binding protein
MMTNKERLEQLIEQIKRLATLSEEIIEREIYPVSYFSQAFDITNKIQEDLHQIEIFQLELFERQMKEHQTLFSQQEMMAPVNIPPPPPVSPVPEMAAPPKSVPPPPPVSPVQEKKPVFPTLPFEKNDWIDLKKVITLNDRFLFCRELFANNENLMNQTISELNKEVSFEASIDYLKKHFEWNFEDDNNVADFIGVLKKRFA